MTDLQKLRYEYCDKTADAERRLDALVDKVCEETKELWFLMRSCQTDDEDFEHYLIDLETDTAELHATLCLRDSLAEFRDKLTVLMEKEEAQ